MPTSAQSAVRASARLSVDGSDCDREPARDNVIPRNVHDHGSSPPRALGGYRNTGRVDRHQLAFDDRFRRSAAIADIHSLAVEPFVFAMGSQWSFGAGRGDLEVVGSVDDPGVLQDWTYDAAHALAVFDGDGLSMVDRYPQRAAARPRLLEGVEVIAHVVERGLEQLFDRRYGPWRHVRGISPITLPEGLEFPPEHQERGRVEDRAVGARDNAD